MIRITRKGIGFVGDNTNEGVGDSVSKDGNGLKCDSKNLELIHLQERINRSITEERNVVPAYKTSEKNKKKGVVVYLINPNLCADHAKDVSIKITITTIKNCFTLGASSP